MVKTRDRSRIAAALVVGALLASCSDIDTITRPDVGKTNLETVGAPTAFSVLEVEPPKFLTLKRDTFNVWEGDTAAIYLRLSPPYDGREVSLMYELSSGTADAGADYEDQPGRRRFVIEGTESDLGIEATILIPTYGDADETEGDQDFSVRLFGLVGAQWDHAGQPSELTATVVILDRAPEPPVPAIPATVFLNAESNTISVDSIVSFFYGVSGAGRTITNPVCSSENPSIAAAVFGGEGICTVVGLSVGETTIAITVESFDDPSHSDDELSATLEVRVVPAIIAEPCGTASDPNPECLPDTGPTDPVIPPSVRPRPIGLSVELTPGLLEGFAPQVLPRIEGGLGGLPSWGTTPVPVPDIASFRVEVSGGEGEVMIRCVSSRENIASVEADGNYCDATPKTGAAGATTITVTVTKGAETASASATFKVHAPETAQLP